MLQKLLCLGPLINFDICVHPEGRESEQSADQVLRITHVKPAEILLLGKKTPLAYLPRVVNAEISTFKLST
jgi:hypothetical protein